MKKTLLALLLSAGVLLAEQADIDTFRYIFNFKTNNCEKTTYSDLEYLKYLNSENNLTLLKSGNYSFGSMYELEVRLGNGKKYLVLYFTNSEICNNFKKIY